MPKNAWFALATTERDLTQLRRAEAQRRQAEFVHDARLTTAGEMAAGLAHELNQPITSIVHFCDVAMSIARDYKPERQQELFGVLEDATSQSARAGEIIRNLRRFLSRAESARDALPVNEIVNDSASLVRGECERNEVQLILNMAQGLPAVDVDKTQISQVLVNLVKNAIDSIVASNNSTRQITIATQAHDNLVSSVQISVHDTGEGIDPETVELLFEPFHTTRPNGLGLGLWISRSLVESHGGRLWADKRTNSGCTFRFSLPTSRGDKG